MPDASYVTSLNVSLCQPGRTHLYTLGDTADEASGSHTTPQLVVYIDLDTMICERTPFAFSALTHTG